VTEVVDVPTAQDMRDLGARLASGLRAGQVVLLVGDLGAGKTTLTQGIARGLGVVEAITSPTFVIAREHASGPGRPALQHVDAYRLHGADDLVDLDLADADRVTVVEWGDRLAPALGEGAVVVTIARSEDDADERRVVTIEWPEVAP
jgi:tRNA threonylcarbamoyladenosine biosynthesis protein TsaE